MKRLGVDIGSTTIKIVVLSEKDEILYSSYERHMLSIKEKLTSLFKKIDSLFPNEEFLISFSGSAAISFAEELNIPFIQEVYSERLCVKKFNKDIDVVIEIGGEDAKIIFLSGNEEVKMNGSCAGGTGAFLDQMSSLLNVSAEEMNSLAEKSTKSYVIASRCGVFAKTDIQSLLNNGVKKEDIASSVYTSIVNQSITSLSSGREIKGNVLYLGGPLTFSSFLRLSFDKSLKTQGTLPENSLYYVSLGAALSEKSKVFKLNEVIKKCSSSSFLLRREVESLDPLFKDDDEREEFFSRHKDDDKGIKFLEKPDKEMYLGIDSGSTTLKAVLIDKEGNLFNPLYVSSKGNPIEHVKKYLFDFYEKYPDVNIVSSCSTGYGEDLIKNAFSLDYGVVETIAHYTSAYFFSPSVDFVLDIGGQDIKCFKIKDGVIESIFLNEACSSGCGSFLETFSSLLGYTTTEFSSLALTSLHPVSLGTRCTVFMNSRVKEAQKNGASIEDIAAGLCLSVVKNALYKVIRVVRKEELGNNIVVQGGTMLNNAVLRCFEKETGKNVLRPSISGLMGCYGAALYAMKKKGVGTSSIIKKDEILNFKVESKAFSCSGCSNHCSLTFNTFGDKRKYIAGNKCSKPLGKKNDMEKYNLYSYKRELLKSYQNDMLSNTRINIGIPLVLNMYELLPFWVTLWNELGYNVIVSPPSTHSLYTLGMSTIPSESVCYPAKLTHGHVKWLIEKGVDYVFYPEMTYNIEEKMGTNHYNCPVVAYYSEVIKNNVSFPEETVYNNPFVDLNNRKKFSHYFIKEEKKFGIKLNIKDVEEASRVAFKELDSYKKKIKDKTMEILTLSQKEHFPVVLLASRPYHADEEVNHGIDKLITELGRAVISEDGVYSLISPFEKNVVDGWTYHTRMYNAAKFVRDSDYDLSLIQLVSFGCGIDAITSDEIRSILESKGKIYTSLKIDEITNISPIKIRLRSLFSVLDDKK